MKKAGLPTATRKMAVASILAGGVLLAPVGSRPASAEGRTKSNLVISPWVVIRDPQETLDLLRQRVEILDSLSLFGTPSREIRDLCREHGIELYLALGGDASHFRDAEAIKATVARWVSAAEGYDGVDLDIEHQPNEPGVRERFSALLRAASAVFREKGKKLAICVGYYPDLARDPSTYWYDPRVIGETCDMVRLMNYDMYFAPFKNHPTTDREDSRAMGPNWTLPWAEDSVKFWLQYVAKEKIVLGMPAYSNDYDMTPQGGGQQVYGHPAVAVEALKAPDTPVDKFWMWHQKINAYRYTAQDGHPHLLYAFDEASAALFMDLVKDSGLAGIAMWHFTESYPEMWDVIYAKAGRTRK